ncbi:hypothetical protein [Lebetimonas sp. JH292]|uniref:hypothetical protein n=1 Tax=Lebetimonas sp. JH292 TaxID=990068 RepID=UPI0012EC81ED|nr:hypothetical protein [Lebetimonas sp. JH292]
MEMQSFISQDINEMEMQVKKELSDNAFNLIMKKIDEREFSKDDIDEEKLDKIDKAVEELKKYIDKNGDERNNIVHIAELLGDSTGTIRGDILKLQKVISADLASVNSNISSVSRQVGSIDRNMISRW